MARPCPRMGWSNGCGPGAASSARSRPHPFPPRSASNPSRPTTGRMRDGPLLPPTARCLPGSASPPSARTRCSTASAGAPSPGRRARANRSAARGITPPVPPCRAWSRSSGPARCPTRPVWWRGNWRWERAACSASAPSSCPMPPIRSAARSWSPSSPTPCSATRSRTRAVPPRRWRGRCPAPGRSRIPAS